MNITHLLRHTDASRLLFQSIIHVSTAYSNCHLSSVEEKFYDYPIGCDHLEDIISKLDDKAIEEITPRYIQLAHVAIY